ncbi:hypothetical protein HAX54_027413 [Datura stramonium]|uniref:Uncharacterized protein n=1 Tax=Datura stramonium TaxID=4076 RepID=A0ABS8V532_DATST|nr:hypothetical protein [Datura stramonium]
MEDGELIRSTITLGHFGKRGASLINLVARVITAVAAIVTSEDGYDLTQDNVSAIQRRGRKIKDQNTRGGWHVQGEGVLLVRVLRRNTARCEVSDPRLSGEPPPFGRKLGQMYFY